MPHNPNPIISNSNNLNWKQFSQLFKLPFKQIKVPKYVHFGASNLSYGLLVYFEIYWIWVDGRWVFCVQSNLNFPIFHILYIFFRLVKCVYMWYYTQFRRLYWIIVTYLHNIRYFEMYITFNKYKMLHYMVNTVCIVVGSSVVPLLYAAVYIANNI